MESDDELIRSEIDRGLKGLEDALEAQKGTSEDN